MASIQAYLHELETRLAPSLDAQALQARLTEAETHLRDRAQEFEEVGLPPLEAEARAVAAFGAPEEFVEDLLGQNAPTVSTRREPVRSDLALQLAVSILALGLVATFIANWTYLAHTGIAMALVVGLGAAFGSPIRLRRLVVLSVVGAVALYGVLTMNYVAFGPNPMHRDELAARKALAAQNASPVMSGAPYFQATSRLRVFEQYQRMAEAGTLPHGTSGGSVLAPSTDPYRTQLETYFGASGQREARAMWAQNGPIVLDALRHEALQERVVRSPHVLSVSPEPVSRKFIVFGVFVTIAGVVLLAVLVAAQILGLLLGVALRRLLNIVKGTGTPRPTEGSWTGR